MVIPEHSELCNLIGYSFELDGRQCLIVEVLEDGPSLVVECITGDPKIQTNQFGGGNRRVVQSHTISLFRTAARDQINPDFEKLWQSIPG